MECARRETAGRNARLGCEARGRMREPARPPDPAATTSTTARRRLLVPERFDRIQPRGFARRVEAEEDPDGGGEAEGENDRGRCQHGAPLRQRADGVAAADAEGDADDAADQRQRDGLYEELGEDVA